MQRLNKQHDKIIYTIIVKKMFDPREPGLTAKFLLENKIIKKT